MLNKKLKLIVLRSWGKKYGGLTLGIGDDGALDASPARNQMPHIDLKLKLHKKMRKERPARTEAE